MKLKYTVLVAAALMAGLGLYAQDEAEPSFPDVLEEVKAMDEAAPSEEVKGEAADAVNQVITTPGEAELTEEQKKQVQVNLDKTADIYKDVLKYDASGRVKAIKKNLEFVTKRLEKSFVDRAELNKQLEELKVSYVNYGKKIQAMKTTDQVKSKKLRQLKRETDFQREFIENRLKNLTSQINRLRSRHAELKMEYATFAPDAPDLEKDKWEELDKKETQAALDELKKHEQEMMEERAEGLDIDF